MNVEQDQCNRYFQANYAGEPPEKTCLGGFGNLRMSFLFEEKRACSTHVEIQIHTARSLLNEVFTAVFTRKLPFATTSLVQRRTFPLSCFFPKRYLSVFKSTA